MHGSMRRVHQKFATQDTHIHQTTISFTYTSNHHKLHIYIKPKLHIYNKPQANKGTFMGHKWNKSVWEEVHLLQYEKNRCNAKYRWINGRNEVGRSRKPNRSRVRRVDLV